MTDTELRRLAEANIGITDVLLAPDVVLALLDRIKALEVERDARPVISVAEARAWTETFELDAAHVVYTALRAHAAKGGE